MRLNDQPATGEVELYSRIMGKDPIEGPGKVSTTGGRASHLVKVSQARYEEKNLFLTTKASQTHFGILDFAQTLWLFTASDFATFVIPDTAFGIFAALSGPLSTSNDSPELTQILTKIPSVILWNWLNVLVFNLSNQRHPESVLEDSINKPWRPIPSGRITIEQTQRLLFFGIPLVLGIAYLLGAWEETALLIVMTWMYNDLGGGDESIISRNVLLAMAFCQHNKASLRVATDGAFDVGPRAWTWLAMTSGIIATTMQIQDMKDQDGDRAKNRQTAPLVLGDLFARWTIAVPMVAWSVACPAFWELEPLGYVLPVGLGMAIAVRIILLRGTLADKRTWWIWTLWTAVIWMLPLFKDHSVLTRFVNQI